MDSSIELQSSPLPRSVKIGNKNTNINRNKAVTKLALRKHFRKSISMGESFKVTRLPAKLCSSSDSINSSATDVDEECKGNCTVVISETEDEIDDKRQYLSQKKADLVEKWLDYDKVEVSTAFSELSTIYGDKITTNTFANSTFITSKTIKFNDYFTKTNKCNEAKTNKEKIMYKKDERKALRKESPKYASKENVAVPNLTSSYENLLNELYGNNWKSAYTTPNNNNLNIKARTEKKLIKHNESIPKLEIATEVKKKSKPVTNCFTEKKQRKSITYKNPYLDSERQKSKMLLDSLQKERNHSRMKSNRKNDKYDSDESESDKENKYQRRMPVKKLFNDSTDDDDLENSDYEGNKKPISSVKVKKRNEKDTQFKQGNENMNFLISLSNNVDINKDGVMYRKSYKSTKSELARKLFKLYNETVFDNRISSDTNIEWNERMTGTAGFCYCKKITRRLGETERSVRIVLSNKILDSADRLRDTLIHEMCHAAAWIVNEIADGHGHYWKTWTLKAMKVYPLLPPIKRCHDYVINTKYTYKCLDCGYSIGRHSKSLDTERKRCGLCYGKFEVYLNKTTKSGSIQTIATPKKGLNKFAQFVKDNYGLVRTPERNHKDVMKILSKKFGDMNTK